MPPKDASAIEIWRQEVSASLPFSSGPSPPTSSLSSHSTTTITPSHSSHTHQNVTIPHQNTVSAQPVSRSSIDIMHRLRPPPVNRTSSFWRRLLSSTKNLTFTLPSSSPLTSSESKTATVVKTEMYSISTDQDNPSRLLGREQEQGEDGDSMDLPSEQNTILGGLRDRAERLRRARRLLDGESSKKDEKRSQDMARMRE